MTLLDTHLEQIGLCSSTISALPFPPPKIFTNALLHANDITALIRDTEAHERALFTIAPPSELAESTSQRGSIFNTTNSKPALKPYQPPRSNSAVAAVLGGDLSEQIQRQTLAGKAKGEVNVEVLLEGAQKLCGVYPIPGAAEKIASFRQRHKKVVASIDHYEALVAEQATQLGRLSRSRSFSPSDDNNDLFTDKGDAASTAPLSAEEMKREEQGIRDLERKKRTLEERVSGMEKDLGGLLR